MSKNPKIKFGINLKLSVLALACFASLVGFVDTAFAAGKLILVNGGSCSGKSTASLELLRSANLNSGNWELFSVDELFKDAYKNKRMFGDEAAAFSKLPVMSQFSHSLHYAVRSKLLENKNVILDHCFFIDEFFHDALFQFRDQAVFFVKMSNSFESACQRLDQRNQSADRSQRRLEHSFVYHHDRGRVAGKTIDGRLIGQDEKCFQGYPTHHEKKYDLEIDSSDLNPEQIAAQILEEFRKANVKPGQFFEAHRGDWDVPKAGKSEWEKSEQPHGCVYVQRFPKRFSDLYGNLMSIAQFGL